MLLSVSALLACEERDAVPDASSDRVPSEAVPPADRGAGAAALVSSFNVEVRSDTVRFSLRVSNATLAPLVLDFATGQRFDFEVRGGGGELVWQWSADRAFTQALQSDTLEAGAVLSYDAVWQAGVPAGAYTATARLLAREHPVELVTRFELRDP